MPTIWFVPRTDGDGPVRDIYSIMDAWGANHCSVCYGHVGAEMLTLAAALRIPVTLHNIPRDRVFRPTCWSVLGDAADPAIDLIACRDLGPMYG